MFPVPDRSHGNDYQRSVCLDQVEQPLARIELRLGMCADNDSYKNDALSAS